MDASSPVTLKIPRPLYARLRRLIEGTGFRSVNQFVVYVLRDLVSSSPQPEKQPESAPLTAEEIEVIRKRLKRLGYL